MYLSLTTTFWPDYKAPFYYLFRIRIRPKVRYTEPVLLNAYWAPEFNPALWTIAPLIFSVIHLPTPSPSQSKPETESEVKHGVRDPMKELSITLPTLGPLQSRLQHIYHGATLCQSRPNQREG